MHASPVLLAASANRFPSSSVILSTSASSTGGVNGYGTGAETRRRGTVAFASGKCVALWDVDNGTDEVDEGEVEGRTVGGVKDGRGVKALLGGHTGDITVLKSLQGLGAKDTRFVSGDAKGGIIVWRSAPAGQDNATPYLPVVQIPVAHGASISALATLPLSTEETLLVTGGSDAVLKLWKIGSTDDSTGVKLVQEVSLGNRLPMDAELAAFGSEDRTILAVGSTDSRISIYTISSDLKLLHAASLPGHSDWIRCLAFQHSNAHRSLLLASGSQDSYIRLWRFTPSAPSSFVAGRAMTSQSLTNGNSATSKADPFAALDALEASLADADTPAPAKGQKVEMKKHPIIDSSSRQERGFVTSEAVLMGHEGWVTNVRWCPSSSTSEPLRLLSTSVDRSMILWAAPEGHEGLWLSVARFGEMSFTTNLGFFGAHFLTSSSGKSEMVMASGWGGAWHVWRRKRKEVTWGPWKSVVAPTGHCKPVTGIDWDGDGELLLSSSMDQTSRIWGPWRREGDQEEGESETWHEVARPQIHGHDVFGAVFVGKDRRTRMVSVAEEKVLRAFEATKGFVRSIGNEGMNSVSRGTDGEERHDGGLSEGAVLPPLSLSNKVVKEGNDDEAGRVDDEVREGLKHPPSEEQLLSSTLWPEVDKLFGHPSELLSVTASSSGRLIASACHANATKHAAIRLWDAATWRPVGTPLEWHGLSVGAMRFQRVEGEGMLVSGSRDRGWALWAPTKEGDIGSYALVQGQQQVHSRVIYDVAWAPSPATEVFATASRDKTIKIWGPEGAEPAEGATAREARKWVLLATVKLPTGARSVDFAPTLLYGRILMAAGLEDGRILFFSADAAGGGGTLGEWRAAGELDRSLAHVDAVTRLAFAPRRTSSAHRLASCGEDGTVRIVDVRWDADQQQ